MKTSLVVVLSVFFIGCATTPPIGNITDDSFDSTTPPLKILFDASVTFMGADITSTEQYNRHTYTWTHQKENLLIELIIEKPKASDFRFDGKAIKLNESKVYREAEVLLQDHKWELVTALKEMDHEIIKNIRDNYDLNFGKYTLCKVFGRVTPSQTYRMVLYFYTDDKGLAKPIDPEQEIEILVEFEDLVNATLKEIG